MKTVEEIVYDVMHEAHRFSNGQPGIQKIEQMRAMSKRIAGDLDTYVTAKVNERLGQFQERVVEAFKVVQTAITELENRHK